MALAFGKDISQMAFAISSGRMMRHVKAAFDGANCHIFRWRWERQSSATETSFQESDLSFFFEFRKRGFIFVTAKDDDFIAAFLQRQNRFGSAGNDNDLIHEKSPLCMFVSDLYFTVKGTNSEKKRKKEL